VIVILDTNIWLAELGLRSPLGAVARLYLQQKHARLALPEVVRLEVEHNLRNRLREYVSTLQDTHRQLLTIFGTLKELVVPDAPAIEGRVTELFGKLGVEMLETPFSLASAKSSFLKTIDKVPPSDRTQEFKDGVLWADCVGLLEDDDVCLVTKDKAFFQDREYAKGLSENLAAEIADAVHTFALMPSLDQLVRDLRVDVAIDESVLVKAYLDKSFEAIDGLLKRNGFVLGEKLGTSKVLYATENPSVLYVEFTIEFEAKETVGDGRTNGVITLRGDGSYDTKLHTFANLGNREEALRFQQSGGDEREVRNVYASMEEFIGHRDVSHTIRRKLP
jgi:PIN domain